MAQRRRTYLQLNNKYLGGAGELLAKGDHVQASEKLWGAAAEIVKAVAARRGKTVRNHARLWDFVTELSEEHPDWRLLEAFSIASALHTNFYEDWLTRKAVETDARVVRDFVEKLKQLL
jgi:hypothetical protein